MVNDGERPQNEAYLNERQSEPDDSNENSGCAKFKSTIRDRKLATATYCAVFWTFGLCIGFLGPTLVDLDCQIGEQHIGSSSWLVASQTVFMMAGTLFTTFFLMKVSTETLLLLGVTVATLMLAIIPFCNTLYGLGTVLAIMGFFIGLLDAGGNIAMIDLHGDKVGPFLQAMHFFYGLGAFLSPLIAAPFLPETHCDLMDVEKKALLHLNTTDMTLTRANRDDTTAHTKATFEESQRFHNAFYIMSVSQIPVIIMCIWLLIQQRAVTKYSSVQEDEEHKLHKSSSYGSVASKDGADGQSGLKCLFNTIRAGLGCATFTLPMSLMLIVLCCILFLSEGMQAVYADYVFAFAKLENPSISSSSAAHMDASFWGMFTLGRLFAVGLAIWLSPCTILTLDVIGCLVFLMIQAWPPGPLTDSMIFAITSGVGFFLSSVCPAAYSLAEQDLGISHSATAILVVMAALGEIVCPVILSQELDKYKAPAFPCMLLFMVAAMILGLSTLVAIQNWQKRQQKDEAIEELGLEQRKSY